MSKKKTPRTRKTKKSLDEEVEDFLAVQDNPFTLAEGVAALKRTSGRKLSQRQLAEELSVREEVFSDPGEKGHYFPRASFFHGARFLIQPTKTELELGVLFPGHRFIPFCSTNVFPPDISLKWQAKKKIPTRTVAHPMADVMIYHTFLGPRDTPMYFVSDHEENEWIFDSTPDDRRPIKLTVFDMGEVYDAYDFRAGDALLCTVNDWRKGTFTVAHLPTDQRMTTDAISIWCTHLEEALLETLDLVGPLCIINDQFAYAFFLGHQYLIKTPAIHLGGFLAQSEGIGMQLFGPHLILWRKDEHPADGMDMGIFNPPSATGTTESLDAMLRDIGLSMTVIDLRAYMRDALYQEHNDLKKVEDRCFAGRALDFVNEAQAKAFRETLRETWDEVKDSYNLFADHYVSEVRSKLLAINDEILAYLRLLDRTGVSPEALPADTTLGLGEISGIISNTLQLLDDPQVDIQELENLSTTLDSLWEPTQGLMEDGRRALQDRGVDI